MDFNVHWYPEQRVETWGKKTETKLISCFLS